MISFWENRPKPSTIIPFGPYLLGLNILGLNLDGFREIRRPANLIANFNFLTMIQVRGYDSRLGPI